MKTVLFFSKKKRLQLNESKCVQLIINPKKTTVPPLLMINDKPIECVTSTKYLGNIISADGSNNKMVQDRISKGKSVMVSILSLANEITLGHHFIKSSILLYKSVFLSSLLFNSQAWSNITATQFNQLRTIQLKVLKRIMHVPYSTTNAFTFLELGILPIIYEIHKRQLIFLHHILSLPQSDPVFKIYEQQKLLPYEKNWANNISSLLSTYSLNGISITEKSKCEWKLLVKSAVRSVAFENLKQECKYKIKTYKLQYDSFQSQEYILSCTSNIASLIFKIRARILNCRDNHHHSHQIITCRLCEVEIENQNHIINCSKVRRGGDVISLDCYHTPKFAIDTERLQTIQFRYQDFLDQISTKKN